jgi:hypothetical protein
VLREKFDTNIIFLRKGFLEIEVFNLAPFVFSGFGYLRIRQSLSHRVEAPESTQRYCHTLRAGIPRFVTVLCRFHTFVDALQQFSTKSEAG